jgi:DNA-binding GntR family transcriptional regulator
MDSPAEHSERYIRLAQPGAPGLTARAYREHEAMAEALRAKDEAGARLIMLPCPAFMLAM